MRVAYVVLYVDDAQLCQRFWVDTVGMVVKSSMQAGEREVARVGFAEQPFAFELVPLALMAENPDGLDLATPSICFEVDDLAATREALVAQGVQASDIAQHGGRDSFAFSDPEGRWFAVSG